ncbi:hypothetical protein HJC23_003415 [Cyclotella cryptica]|uniref:E3 ubiquitin-protein ligase FANCL n=1 Tax=Cyclotella cryptica TaxID=29204 RepID=A0ABD3QRW7_9STRA|eukprot:CCRYP_002558-RA/>CCRYP_002558-RA protein AED:0.01 eAED:0.00 QI:0/-1/0/1/-1/1/1/0/537
MSDLDPIAILSDISANQLESTVHCHDYRCLLRLRSFRSDGGDACVSNQISIPDVLTLSATPIVSDQEKKHHCLGRGNDDTDVGLPLLPKLRNETSSGEKIPSPESWQNHPCGELIRTSNLLQTQLYERLKDASNGALSGVAEGPLGIHEEFLRRSEAIIKELLEAIQQHLRKEQACNDGDDRNTSTKQHNSSHRKNAPLHSNAMKSHPPLSYYAALLRQLQILHETPNVIDINLYNADSSKNTDKSGIPTDITRLSVTCMDGKKRSHTWHAELYPSIVLTVDFPEDFSLIDNNLELEKWWDDEKSASNHLLLPEIQRRFQQGLDRYQPLFDELDQLDSHLWILEPSLPARRCSIERRIALWEGGASMVIVLDPEKPRAIPVLVRFIGLTAARNADKDVDWSASFADFVTEGAEEDLASKRWSEERSVRENLELWFGSPLPSPLSSVKSDYLVECGICYTHRLPSDDVMSDENLRSEEGALPDVKCNNLTCNKHYHEACLFEWLHSLPTAKTSFDRIFGSCPYCCEAVSVSTANGRRN